MSESELDLDAQLLAQMREDFLAESKDLLERLGPLLIELERGVDPEVIHTIFRSLHTMKGTAAFVGLETMRTLAHKMEDLFGAVRSGTLPVTPELIDLTLAGVQSLAALREDVTKGGAGELDVAPLLARLVAMAGAATPVGGVRPASIGGLRAALGSERGTPGPQSDDRELEAQSSPELPAPPSGATTAPERPAPTESAPGDTFPEPAVVAPAVERRPATESTPAALESTLRVDVETLDTLMTLVGELITARNALVSTAERLGDEPLMDNALAIHRLARQLQTAVASVRLMPVERLFTRFTSVVRTLGRDLGKQVRLVIEGGQTPLDRTLCDGMYDPLVHLLRNAVDHGLEPPEVRRAAGKPTEGVIRLSAERHGDDVVLRVSDDGAGIDPARMRRVAVDNGVLTAAEAAALTDSQALGLIFRTGFSTARVVTDLSGRGVGMDVVADHVRRLRGHVDLESRVGQGTTFVIRLPVTLAILQVLLARVGAHIYALPMYALRETLRLAPAEIETVRGYPAAFVREEPLPVRRLSDLLPGSASVGGGHSAARGEGTSQAVIVRLTRGDEVWLVDELLGKQQVVIKPLGAYLGVIQGVEGAAILPDGSVTLVLNVESLMN